MPTNNVLQWLDGRGWLIFSGASEAGSDIRATALERAAADGGVAYVWIGDDAAKAEIQGDELLDDFESLGAPSGYMVNVLTEDDDTIRDRLSEASVIVVGGDATISTIRSALLGAAAEGIQAAFENGAVVLVEGTGIVLFGSWLLLETEILTAGMEWLNNALMLPGVTSVAQSIEAQEILRGQPAAIAVGIGAGSALALGPDGELEVWGQGQVTIAFGSHYTI
ncbi:MAG: hypothetical protein H7175_12390 [Burkholderiales bacterium]|nr:hypothetical protein [Anaerolineae bacterium]